jgi:dihydroxy-acid dehydratase
VGGPIALIEDGDIIAIDAEKGTLDLEVDASVIEKRRAAWKAPTNPYQSGALRKFADQVGPARFGAVTHPGGKAEIVCYADI